MNDIYVSLFCTRLFLSLNDMCPEFGQSRTFFSSALSPFSDYRFDIRLLEFCRLLVLSSRHPVEILMNIFWKSFQFWTTEKNQEYRGSPVEQESGILSLVSLFCEFLARFLWLGRIRHSGHLGVKLWINNTIPQVWGYCSFFSFLQLLLLDYVEIFVEKGVTSY